MKLTGTFMRRKRKDTRALNVALGWVEVHRVRYQFPEREPSLGIVKAGCAFTARGDRKEEVIAAASPAPRLRSL